MSIDEKWLRDALDKAEEMGARRGKMEILKAVVEMYSKEGITLNFLKDEVEKIKLEHE